MSVDTTTASLKILKLGNQQIEDEPVYDSGLFKAIQSGKVKLIETEKQITSLLHYKWSFSYELKEVEEKQVFVIMAELGSRYIFDDHHKVSIHLEANGKELVSEQFDLNKTMEKQECSIFVESAWSSILDEISVFVNFFISDISYSISKWATEVNLKSSGRTHDVVIAIGETKFYVLRSYLATWSRYFDRLFYGSFKEKNQSVIKLEEVDADAFYQVLRLIHPGLVQSIHEDNVLEILKVADRFDIPNIMARCGVVLCDFDKCQDLDLIDRLELADKHNLVDLLMPIVILTGYEGTESIKIDAKHLQLSSTLKQAIAMHDTGADEITLPLPNIRFKALKLVVDFLKHCTDDDKLISRDVLLAKLKIEDLSGWDSRFLFPMDNNQLMKMACVADFLNLDHLSLICAKKIAGIVKGFSSEDCRSFFKLTDEWKQDDYKLKKKEMEWLFGKKE